VADRPTRWARLKIGEVEIVMPVDLIGQHYVLEREPGETDDEYAERARLLEWPFAVDPSLWEIDDDA
jgi:hypothetical protein